MSAVRNAINQIADGFNGLTPSRQAEIERTINQRVTQSVNEEAARRFSNVDARIKEAQTGAQKEYDARTQSFIDQVNALPPEQKAKLCENSASNPLVQAACKP